MYLKNLINSKANITFEVIDISKSHPLGKKKNKKKVNNVDAYIRTENDSYIYILIQQMILLV